MKYYTCKCCGSKLKENPTPEGTYRCSKCFKYKTVEEFYLKKNSTNRPVYSMCKACNRKRHANEYALRAKETKPVE